MLGGPFVLQQLDRAPRVGPVVYLPADFHNVSIGAGATVTGVFFFPRPIFVVGVSIIPASGLAADAANLEYGFTDETQDQFASDGTGLPGSNAAPVNAMMGGDLSTPWPLQRPVQGQDRWVQTLFNKSGAPITVAAILLFLEEVARG